MQFRAPERQPHWMVQDTLTFSDLTWTNEDGVEEAFDPVAPDCYGSADRYLELLQELMNYVGAIRPEYAPVGIAHIKTRKPIDLIPVFFFSFAVQIILFSYPPVFIYIPIY